MLKKKSNFLAANFSYLCVFFCFWFSVVVFSYFYNSWSTFYTWCCCTTFCVEVSSCCCRCCWISLSAAKQPSDRPTDRWLSCVRLNVVTWLLIYFVLASRKKIKKTKFRKNTNNFKHFFRKKKFKKFFLQSFFVLFTHFQHREIFSLNLQNWEICIFALFNFYFLFIINFFLSRFENNSIPIQHNRILIGNAWKQICIDFFFFESKSQQKVKERVFYIRRSPKQTEQNFRKRNNRATVDDWHTNETVR